MCMTALTLFSVPASASAPISYEECEVVAVIAREELSLDKKVGPPLRPGLGAYLPKCDWRLLTLKGFAEPTDWSAGRLIIEQPKIRGRSAQVRYTVIYGPRSGGVYDCRLSKPNFHWKLIRCDRRIAI